jgi:hypothetical protein
MTNENTIYYKSSGNYAQCRQCIKIRKKNLKDTKSGVSR